MDIVCNSRQKTVHEMLGYFNQEARRRAALTEHGGTDPIWPLWVWKPVQVASDDGTCRSNVVKCLSSKSVKIHTINHKSIIQTHMNRACNESHIQLCISYLSISSLPFYELNS